MRNVLAAIALLSSVVSFNGGASAAEFQAAWGTAQQALAGTVSNATCG